MISSVWLAEKVFTKCAFRDPYRHELFFTPRVFKIRSESE